MALASMNLVLHYYGDCNEVHFSSKTSTQR